MAESLRGGVIGAGVFGGYHARQYAKLDGVVLSAVLDPHPDRAAKVAVPPVTVPIATGPRVVTRVVQMLLL